MPISNPLLPSVPDGLHVDDLRFDAGGLVTWRIKIRRFRCSHCPDASLLNVC